MSDRLVSTLTAYGNLIDLVDSAVPETMYAGDTIDRGSAIRHNAVQLEDHLDHDLPAAATTAFNIAIHAYALLTEIFVDLAARSGDDTLEDLIGTFAATRGVDDE